MELVDCGGLERYADVFKFDYNGQQKTVSTAAREPQQGAGAVKPELEIRLNGEAFRVPSGSSLADLIRRLELKEDRVAVELDRRIVPRPQWPRAMLTDASAVEIVQLVGGG